MKHVVTNLSKKPIVLPFASGALSLKPGESAEADVGIAAAARIARHGVAGFQAIAKAFEPLLALLPPFATPFDDEPEEDGPEDDTQPSDPLNQHQGDET
jgi:hypothetical protein